MKNYERVFFAALGAFVGFGLPLMLAMPFMFYISPETMGLWGSLTMLASSLVFGIAGWWFAPQINRWLDL